MKLIHALSVLQNMCHFYAESARLESSEFGNSGDVRRQDPSVDQRVHEVGLTQEDLSITRLIRLRSWRLRVDSAAVVKRRRSCLVSQKLWSMVYRERTIIPEPRQFGPNRGINKE